MEEKNNEWVVTHDPEICEKCQANMQAYREAMGRECKEEHGIGSQMREQEGK